MFRNMTGWHNLIEIPHPMIKNPIRFMKLQYFFTARFEYVRMQPLDILERCLSEVKWAFSKNGSKIRC